ncbi:glycosyltransferase family 2 protein [Paracoccus sp. (in: a-proteobacteria)]|uniref:glycosyltransferase n=1 Tax=Paracoccus sp. TaxID=267 RepID=UPI0026E04C22|nr:glycosyltransferase [Paracoccus sp. (in: a-proteobacteria)]MDO5646438.1 glycosyltransferase [Paracoccus sp. (in: a-proteobacteria)]
MHPENNLSTAAVIIGRNEGARLVRCLESARAQGLAPVVYVDSGSTDDSVLAAHDLGAQVVMLDSDRPFTAARARNAGFDALAGLPGDALVQFIDGDCELRDGWVATARDFLRDHAQAAIVAGRVRERHPDASIYNQLCDAEWDRPAGETDAVGGIFVVRAGAFRDAGGFNPALIAGEEPELCLRLRHAGWQIWRLDHEMVWHDAAMTRFGQWWRRMRRGGHATAEAVAMHGPNQPAGARLRRALIWGLALPIVAVLGAVVTPWALLVLLAYPAQIARLARRSGCLLCAAFQTLSKLPEALGALRYYWGRVTSRHQGLIEYK